ncbi:MAG TPA: transporter substrate-binding domain-containing protein [Actinomycetota bacterium]|jgi:polar amino acid transport system substrate-binding protein
MRKRQTTRVAALLCVGLLTLAACGDDGGDGDGGDAAAPITGVDSLPDGARVAVQASTTGAFYAEENLTNVELVKFPKAPAMYQALEAGQVVAVFNDLPVSLEAIKGKPDLQVVEQVETGEEYAIAVNKENTALLEAVNGALEELFADGTYTEIYEKYFPEQELPSYATEGGGGAGGGAAAGGDYTLVEPGHLTVGSDIPYAPFEFEEGGELTGFDVELVRAISEKLGLENTDDDWLSVNFDTIFTQLQNTQKFDIVVAAVTGYAPDGSPAAETVAERKTHVDFTIPYYPSLQSLTIDTSQSG